MATRTGQRFPWVWLWGLITAVAMAGLFGLTIYLTSREKVTEYEQGLLSFILFAAGAVLTFAFGRWSVKSEAADLIRRDGRKAVRRIFTLGYGVRDFGGLVNREASRLSDMTDSDGMVPAQAVDASFFLLRSHIPVQVRTITDTIEDWRDIVPDEVADLERGAEEAMEELAGE